MHLHRVEENVEPKLGAGGAPRAPDPTGALLRFEGLGMAWHKVFQASELEPALGRPTEGLHLFLDLIVWIYVSKKKKRSPSEIFGKKKIWEQVL